MKEQINKNFLNWKENSKVKQLMDKYLSNNSGLLKNLISFSFSQNNLPNLFNFGAEMPKYEKIFFENRNSNISYHLGGYSKNINDAIFRILGEAVERYSSVMFPKTIENEFIISSAKEIKIKENTKILPIEFMNNYDNIQRYELKNILPHFNGEVFTENEKITWIKLKNLKDKNDYYVPVQLFFLTGHYFDKTIYNFSFTTGTSAHINLEKSLINSFIEVFQLHNFMIFWNSKVKDGFYLNVPDIFFKEKLKNTNIVPHFIYINDSKINIHTIISILENDKFPFFSFGIQSAFSLFEAIERALDESIAVFGYNIFQKIFPNNFIKKDFNKSIDLDSNVFFYASNTKDIPKKYLYNMFQNLTKKNLDSFDNSINFKTDKAKLFSLVKSAKKNFKFIFIYDITAEELSEDYVVTRVFIPELVSLSFPNFFTKEHPFIKKNKIELEKNVLLHPLP